MDTDNLVQQAQARFHHEVAKRVLREKYQAKMIFAYNGGLFRAGPELIALLQACPVEDPIVIADLYDNPIKINPNELQYLALDRWQEQMNAWRVEFEQISSTR